MITVTPNKNLLNVQVEQGATTYIAALNPRLNDAFVAHIPESSVRTQFTVTDLLDGTEADEYLTYDCPHAVITSKFVGGTMRYQGVVVNLNNPDPLDPTKERFSIVETLDHAACVLRRSSKVGVTVDNWTYAGMANVSKVEETNRAKAIAIQENTIYV